MSTIQVSTENPMAEQWRLLSQYSYPSNIRKFLVQRGFGATDDDSVELIAGSMRQAQAFFDAAATAPLDVSPLLLYYGATSLLIASSAMLCNSTLPIENHGMMIPKGSAARLADVSVLPRNSQHGALQLLSNVFSNRCDLVNGGSWTLGEIIGSIPDLKHDFENHYQDLQYFTVPIEMVQTKDRIVERIRCAELRRYESPARAMALVGDLPKSYLGPQYKTDFVILFRKRGGIDIGGYSITGRKYLSMCHIKRGRAVSPHQVILMYMGLYVLGFLPRYRPHLWNPFVRSDATGEKFIIEKFVSVCTRFFPNLVLNFLVSDRMQFVNKTEGVLDLTGVTTHDEIKKVVKETIRELRATGDS